jgi:hypothetical protein
MHLRCRNVPLHVIKRRLGEQVRCGKVPLAKPTARSIFCRHDRDFEELEGTD